MTISKKSRLVRYEGEKMNGERRKCQEEEEEAGTVCHHVIWRRGRRRRRLYMQIRRKDVLLSEIRYFLCSGAKVGRRAKIPIKPVRTSPPLRLFPLPSRSSDSRFRRPRLLRRTLLLRAAAEGDARRCR